MMMRMRVIIDDAVEIHVDWDYLTGLLTTLTVIIYSGFHQTREQQHLQCLLWKSLASYDASYPRKHSQFRIREVDKSRLHGNNLPIRPTARPLWVGVGLVRKTRLTRLGFEPTTSRSVVRRVNHYTTGTGCKVNLALYVDL